jgi:hypothetical protein
MNVKLRSYLLLMCFLFQEVLAQQGVLDTRLTQMMMGFREMVLTYS